ncbi:hypothetical protein AMTRI_Chr10g225860 [Amborella trichopoda]
MLASPWFQTSTMLLIYLFFTGHGEDADNRDHKGGNVIVSGLLTLPIFKIHVDGGKCHLIDNRRLYADPVCHYGLV